MKLNLGCSSDVRGNGWTNVDLVQPCDQVADLALPWPWEDSSVDEIYAADIFEHIGDCRHMGKEFCDWCCRAWRGITPPARAVRAERARIHVMNEAHRVLKSGGLITMECPDAAKGAGQWQDPTHVTPWTPNGLQYFADGSPAHKRFAAAYGITARFKVHSVQESSYIELAGQVRCEVFKFRAVLEAIK